MPLRVPPKVLKNPKALEQYVHEKIFPKISASQRSYLTQYWTILFSDGFETNDFNAWTGTEGDSPTAPAVETNNPHHGTHNAIFVCPAINYTDCYKTIVSTAITYLRAYVKFNTLPAASHFMDILGIQYTDWQNAINVRVKEDSGDVYWGLRIVEGGGENLSFEAVASNPTTGAWYCIEFMRDVTNDQQQLWVNTVSKVSDTVNISNNSNRIFIGFDGVDLNAGTQTMYVDCVVAADAPIGPEGAAVAKAKLILMGHKPHTVGITHPRI